MSDEGDDTMQSLKVVTLSDIAERLGTSKNTVSRALRDCSDIGAEMKARVKKTATEMGYQPNQVASFIRSRKSRIIAVVISSLTNPFFTISLEFIFNYLTEKNYHPLIIVSNKGNLSYEEIVRCMQSGACGILTYIDLTKDAIDYCEQYEIPVLMCGSKPYDDRISAVYSDSYRCGKLIAQEAIDCGAKRPCYINGPDSTLNENRRDSFMEVLAETNLPCDSYDFNYDNLNASVERIKNLIATNGNDFVLCFNDEIATVLLKAYDGEGGFQGEIYGIDGISKYLPYSRTVKSVGGDLEKISRRCGHILLEKIINDDKKIVREIFPIEIYRAELRQ